MAAQHQVSGLRYDDEAFKNEREYRAWLKATGRYEEPRLAAIAGVLMCVLAVLSLLGIPF